jgi:hypothetical protein
MRVRNTFRNWGNTVTFKIASGIFCVFMFSGFSNSQQCGSRLTEKRILVAGPETEPDFYSRLTLISLQRKNKLSRIMLNMDRKGYASYDHGQSWHKEITPLSCRQYATMDTAGGVCIISNSDPNVLYRIVNDPRQRGQIEKSFDAGHSWRRIRSKTSKGNYLGSIQLVGTGALNSKRVYAQISAVGEHGVYISENSGETFSPLLNWGRYVVECRASAAVLFSIKDDAIVVSNDRGISWNVMESSRTIFSPLFMKTTELQHGGREIKLRSWRENDDVGWKTKVKQIETDPKDPATFYVLSSVGLFRSMDAGQSYWLLPLAENRVNAIDMVAVDPLNGRYLFAIVSGAHLFRSSDYGCSWQEIRLPD